MIALVLAYLAIGLGAAWYERGASTSVQPCQFCDARPEPEDVAGWPTSAAIVLLWPIALASFLWWLRPWR